MRERDELRQSVIYQFKMSEKLQIWSLHDTQNCRMWVREEGGIY